MSLGFTMKTIRLFIFVSACLLGGSAYAAGYGISDSVPPSQMAAQQAKIAAAKTEKAKQQQQEQESAAGDVDALGSTDVSRQAFLNMMRQVMPLSPEQIKTLRHMYEGTQKAATEYPGVPPKPTSNSVIVNLAPGSTPPIIRMRKGFVTSLVFLDSSGQPWPVEAYDLGNPDGFNIQWDKKSHTLLVQAMNSYLSGNLAVILKGLDTPIMVTMMPGQRAVDYRVDLRVPGLGPNGKPTVSGLPATGSSSLLTFLNGVPPQGAKTLQVNGGQAQAWMYNGKLYLRTQLTLLSPGWSSSMRSPDGTNVYELAKTPVVLVSQLGAIQQLSIEGL